MNPWLNILPTYGVKLPSKKKKTTRTFTVKPYCCAYCGETNPANFYAYPGRVNKSTCKTCKNKQASLQRFAREGKKVPEGYVYTKRVDRGVYLMPHKCKGCGQTGAENFYSPMKSYCKACRNKRIVAKRKQDRSMIV